MKNVVVQKFGGTSVGSAERIKAVAERIKDRLTETKHILVVVSAMGDTTDKLISLAKEMSTSPSPREYDALVSNGENISAALLAMRLNALNIDAISLTGPQAGIKTSDLHTKAKIQTVDTNRIEQELQQHQVIVITGFQGVTACNNIATIGRGGSDTSAVVLAAAIGAEECEIYTDVDGVYTTDPRKVKKASKCHTISYDEMLELASLGAKVLHPRAVECAKENNIIIHVRSSFDKSEGTRVKETLMEMNKPVTGITANSEESFISILGLPDNPGAAGHLFTKLGDAGINVDMIIQSVEGPNINNISFSIQEDDLDRAKEITNAVATELGAKGIQSTKDIAKVSIVGVGMISKPGVAAKMFKTLGEANINILRISTSEIKISCAIERDKAPQAVQLLHTAFGLDA